MTDEAPDLDEIDLKLLRALAADATRNAGDLGREVRLSQPATWRRIRRLSTRSKSARSRATTRRR